MHPRRIGLAALAAAVPLVFSLSTATATTTLLLGASQSPIDLEAEAVTFVEARELDALKFRYPRRVDLELVNTGETLRADVPAGAAELRVGRTTYELLQFHFHTPSEHLVDGRSTPLEMHLVHRSAGGELMVVGVFLEEGPEQPLDALIRVAPEEEGTSTAIDDFPIRTLLPKDLSSYRYAGSLTTPPFTEGVRWAVMSEPMKLTPAEIEHVRELIPHGNARDVQPLNDREILSDAAGN